VDESKNGFRFRNLEIWRRGANIGVKLFELADQLDERRKYRFAEQLRSAALSISNNIAEGSGSDTNADFKRFLSYARKSVFECASMMIIFEQQQLVSKEATLSLVFDLESLSKMLTAFSRKLV
jgi:four helix bundle protein